MGHDPRVEVESFSPHVSRKLGIGMSQGGHSPWVGFFEGFKLDYVDTGEATLRVRHGGSGSPVVLLHGHPRTHVTWHAVAAQLVKRHAVVCPDLRGYGESSHPPELPNHATYSKRRWPVTWFG